MKQMTTYEQCIKVGAMLNPPLALNRWPQEGYGTWSRGGKDYTTDIGKLLVDVGSEVEGSLMDQEMRGLAKVNLKGWEWWAYGWKLKHSWA